MRSSLRRRASLGTAFAALGLGLTTLAAHPAVAQTAPVTIYDNTVGLTGSGYENGGATAASPATSIVADDITPAAGFDGDAVTGFTFSMVNFGAVDTTASPTAYFYSVDPTSGNPATLLASVAFSPITVSAGTGNLFSFSNPTALFDLPSMDPGSGVTFWAGLSFSGAPVSQLNTLGQFLNNTPTTGTSQDVFFQSSDPAPTTPVSNPVGSLFYFGGPPTLANFAWSFQVTPPPAVPEASTTVSLGLLLALGMGGLIVASKRKKASASA